MWYELEMLILLEKLSLEGTLFLKREFPPLLIIYMH